MAKKDKTPQGGETEKKHAGGRPPIFAEEDALASRMDSYFAECDEKEKPYTIAGLALHLGMTTQGLREYQEKDKFSCIIKKAKQKVEANVESLLLEGKGSGAIFWLKNHAGYKDIQQTNLADANGEKIDLTVNFVSPPHNG